MMDNFVYHYEDGLGGTTNEPLYLNRLASVQDLASAEDGYSLTDVNSGQATNNYQYNASGQLVKDLQEGIEEIGWTATGKVKYIRFTTAAKGAPMYKRDVRFIYDPMDLRIAKIENTGANGKSFECTYYSYDASGNLLASYVRTFQAQGQGGSGPFEDILSLDEHYIYGVSRLGAEKRDEIIMEASALQSETQTANPLSMYSDLAFFFWSTPTIHPFEHSYREVGDKNFELSNHLGNVLVVVTDQKGPHTTLTSSYAPNVVAYSDYEPYGMLLEGRHGQDGVDYRYGFQGQEMDDKIKGEGNSANYKYRMHDPRIGRFFAIDPLAAKYPHWTPYQFSGNQVIHMVELEGLEPAPTELGSQYGERTVAQDGTTGEWQKYSWEKVTSTMNQWKSIGNFFQDINKKQINIPNNATDVEYKYLEPYNYNLSSSPLTEYKGLTPDFTFTGGGYYYVESFTIDGEKYSLKAGQGFWNSSGGKFSNKLDANGNYAGNSYETYKTQTIMYADIVKAKLDTEHWQQYMKDAAVDFGSSLFLDFLLNKAGNNVNGPIDFFASHDNYLDKQIHYTLMLNGPGSYTEVLDGMSNPDWEYYGRAYRTFLFNGYNSKTGEPIFTEGYKIYDKPILMGKQ